MTMSCLQDTRIGHILQSIRHNVNPPLQKRIRFIIKSWQKLLSSDFTYPYVIPINQIEKSNCLSNKSNGAHIRPTTITTALVTSSCVSTTGLLSTVTTTNLSDKKTTTDGNQINFRQLCDNHKKHTLSQKICNNNNIISGSSKRSSLSDTNLMSNFCHTEDSQNSMESQADVSYSCRSLKRIKLETDRSSLFSNSVIYSSVDKHSESFINGTATITTNICGSTTDSTFVSHSSMNSIKSPIHSSNSFSKKVGRNKEENLNNDKCVPNPPNQTVRLAKVKSTAELIRVAGDCIDSVTADRILTASSRINKEIDLRRPVSVAPSVRTPKSIGPSSYSGRISVSHGKIGETNLYSSFDSSTLNPLSEGNKSQSIFKDVDVNVTPYKEKLEKIKDRYTIKDSLISESSPKKDTSVMHDVSFTSSSSASNVKSYTDCNGQYPIDVPNIHFKKKKKKHSKSINDGGSLDDCFLSDERNYKHQTNSVFLPPITNHMDDWPVLPSVPEHIDWFSLERDPIVTNSGIETEHISEHQLDTCDNNEHWNPNISNHTFHQNFLDPNELYSILLDDQYLHVLPWVDMHGYRRQFFPSDTAEELDRLTQLPEPW